ncbi:hypothetical protein [Phenylobacterium montanum]|uniref:DUF2066 domain-containing protein n=1 Tax=Phenylobacterium montanum TaxID=2823693 RepID=A0A975FY97_9CAUL|nr:hypothetical protein [Caulobacter sp. S6]QUD87424.1 hypothetical protein KCG34_20590 [Caulobacter sp. S6]
MRAGIKFGSRWLIATRLASAVAVLLLSLFAPSLAQAEKVPLSPDAFTAALAERFRAALPRGKVEIAGALTLKVDAAAGPGTAYLDRIYQACQQDQGACDGLVDDFVAKMAAYQNTPPAPLSRSQLRVVVRPSDYVEAYRQAMAGKFELVAAPLVGDLWLVGAADEPTTIDMLNSKMATLLKLSPDEAIALGEKNMRDSVRRQVEGVTRQPVGGFAVLSGDAYASSALAFPDLFAPLAARASGDLLVAAPAADTLVLLAGGGDSGPKDLAKVAKAGVASAERPISAAVFRWSDKGWVEVLVPARRSRREAAASGQ